MKIIREKDYKDMSRKAAMSPDEAPVVITQNEFMRRMKEMAAAGGGGMSQFYGQMPDNFTIAVNGNHPIVADILSDAEKAYGDKLKSITKKIDAAVAEENRFEEVTKGKKEEELTAEEKAMREEADHRPGVAHERDAQGQEPDGFHPALDFADRKVTGRG